MHTKVLDQNWTRNFFWSIGYPIGPRSKLYKDNQATIKILLVKRITPQSRPINVIIITLHEIYFQKTFEMVDTGFNMQLDVINSKPRGGKSLRDII